MRLTMFRLLATAVALYAILPGCTPGVEVTVLGGSTMATSYTARVADPVADSESLGREIQALLDEIETDLAEQVESFDGAPTLD